MPPAARRRRTSGLSLWKDSKERPSEPLLPRHRGRRRGADTAQASRTPQPLGRRAFARFAQSRARSWGARWDQSRNPRGLRMGGAGGGSRRPIYAPAWWAAMSVFHPLRSGWNRPSCDAQRRELLSPLDVRIRVDPMIGLLIYASTASMGPAVAPEALNGSTGVQIAAACEASLAVIRSMVATPGTPLIFNGWEGSSSPERSRTEYRWSPTQYATEHHLSAPSRETITLLQQDPNMGRSAVTNCPTIRNFLTQHHVRYGAEETMSAIRNQEQEVVIVAVSLAAIDPTGRIAIVTRGQSGTGGGGGGWVQALIRDQASSWQEAYTAPTWIT